MFMKLGSSVLSLRGSQENLSKPLYLAKFPSIVKFLEIYLNVLSTDYIVSVIFFFRTDRRHLCLCEKEKQDTLRKFKKLLLLYDF